MFTKLWSEILKGRDCLGDLGIGGRILLKLMLRVKGLDSSG
jgi:hypothetical protein